MAVDIAIDFDLPLLLDHLGQILGCVDDGVEIGRRVAPLPVEVAAHQVRTVVTVDDAVDI